jgi:hypothetical protein
MYVTPHVQRTVKKCVLREHSDLHLKLWGIQNKDMWEISYDLQASDMYYKPALTNSVFN